MKILVYFSIIHFTLAIQDFITEKLGQFCSNHNKKYLSILFSSQWIHSNQTLSKLMKMDFRVRTIKNIDNLEDQDFFVMFHSTENDFQFWNIVSHRLIKLTLVIVEKHKLDELTAQISQENLSLNLYCLVYNEDLFEFKEIFKLKNQKSVIVKSAYDNDINLQGIHIPIITGEWKPYVKIDNCNQIGTKHDIKGFAVDIMDGAADYMNFTWNAEISDDWGMTPKSGPFNMSGEWGGVMGNVVLGNYEVSVNVWLLTLERSKVLDHAITLKNDPSVLLTKTLPTKLDWSFYKRPFHNKLWIGIMIFGFVFAMIYWTSYNLSSNALDITGFSIWIFFTLIQAFYCGSLTMFFLSQVEAPFKNLDEAMLNFPNWNTIFISGWEFVFESPANKVYQKFHGFN